MWFAFAVAGPFQDAPPDQQPEQDRQTDVARGVPKIGLTPSGKSGRASPCSLPGQPVLMFVRGPFSMPIRGPDCAPFETYAPPAFPIRRKTGLSRLQRRKIRCGRDSPAGEEDSKSGPSCDGAA